MVEDFRMAAVRAMEAGFDGVELHAANGYLVDQFLRDGVNRRSDRYGGSPDNRIRLLLEVTDALCDAVGADRTGVRLSPFTVTWDCADSDPRSVFLPAVQALAERGLAFLEIVERGFDSVAVSNPEVPDGFNPVEIRAAWNGVLMVNGGYHFDSACAALESGHAQLVSLARPFISTADVVERYREGRPLNPDQDMATWYGGGAEGYCE